MSSMTAHNATHRPATKEIAARSQPTIFRTTPIMPNVEVIRTNDGAAPALQEACPRRVSDATIGSAQFSLSFPMGVAVVKVSSGQFREGLAERQALALVQ